MESAECELTLDVAELSGLAIENGGRVVVRSRLFCKQASQYDEGANVSACRRASDPHLGDRQVDSNAAAGPIQFAQHEHRLAMAVFGGLTEEFGGAGVVRFNAPSVQVKHGEAGLGCRIALFGGALEPTRRLREVCRAAVAAREQHAEAELSEIGSLGCGCGEPPMRLRKISWHTEPGCMLIGQTNLGGCIAAFGCHGVPSSRFDEIAADGHPLGKQPP
jgi:hypothetical protein